MPRRHLLFILTDKPAVRIQGLRREWDPVMAERIPPHVTLIYPEEVNDEDLLIERIAKTAQQTAPFEMSMGNAEESNLGGVWLRVVDQSNTWSQMRETLLTPPFTPFPVIPHITVVHPRTSQRGPEALADMDGKRIRGEFHLDEVLFTETSRNGMQVLERFPLARSTSSG